MLYCVDKNQAPHLLDRVESRVLGPDKEYFSNFKPLNRLEVAS